jgi:hypothetical protein
MLVVFGGGGRWRGSRARYPLTTDNRPQSRCPAEALARHNTLMAGTRRMWALPVVGRMGSRSVTLVLGLARTPKEHQVTVFTPSVT